jgi:hypothetical protein
MVDTPSHAANSTSLQTGKASPLQAIMRMLVGSRKVVYATRTCYSRLHDSRVIFCSIRHSRNYLFRADYLVRVSRILTLAHTVSLTYTFTCHEAGAPESDMYTLHLSVYVVARSHPKKYKDCNRFEMKRHAVNIQQRVRGIVTVRARKPSRKGDY